MDGIAIVMMAMFIIVIWGGLAIATVSLMKNPDEAAGALGTGDDVSNEVLAAQEQQ
ncbi:methionine/alanine import NSS transporter subunit MetS [Corynebacterium sp. H113]|uniref:methionine/alanine import NSS transporter subunit MetS n=1 Tax=Corynebacterium sp. H113 TaxID=3133419 RepID=UPI0030B72FBB